MMSGRICDLRRHLRGLIPLMFVPMVYAQQPHQHGVVPLNIAIDQGVMFVELIVPLEDVAGFEHWPAADEAEQASVDRAVAVISDPQSLFSIPAAAKCKLKDVEVQLPGDDHGDDDLHTDSPLADAESETHLDIVFLYRFNCKAPNNLNELRVHLFRLFPNLQSIEANLITDTEQVFQQLDFSDPVVFIPR